MAYGIGFRRTGTAQLKAVHDMMIKNAKNFLKHEGSFYSFAKISWQT